MSSEFTLFLCNIFPTALSLFLVLFFLSLFPSFYLSPYLCFRQSQPGQSSSHNFNMELHALRGTHCFAANQDTIYFIMTASATEEDSPSMLVLGQSQRFPTSIEVITWTIISSTPITHFDTVPTFRPHLATYRCSVSSEGVFTFRYQYDDRYDIFSGFRYDPRIQRQKKTGTCNAITPELGDWERVDLSMPDDVRFAQKIMVIPEASDAASSSDGTGTSTGNDAWMIFFQPKGIIRYAGFDSASYKEKIYTEDLVVMDPVSSHLYFVGMSSFANDADLTSHLEIPPPYFS